MSEPPPKAKLCLWKKTGNFALAFFRSIIVNGQEQGKLLFQTSRCHTPADFPLPPPLSRLLNLSTSWLGWGGPLMAWDNSAGVERGGPLMAQDSSRRLGRGGPLTAQEVH